MDDFDQLRMLECLSLAEKGAGYVSPNPMVGAVLVKNGKVVGRGHHRRFGGPHAEVYALRQAGKNSRGGTLYVNLEPCCHYGKTPPCTDLIIQSGVKRVVVGMKDPNPLVNGKGIRILRSKGIKVDVGILQEDCRKLNEVFEKYVTTGLPFVTLKIAQTLDGKIADANGHSRWITNVHSRKLVHALRARYDAVLVGANTVRKDDPRLTVRFVKGRNPYRVVLDGNLSLSLRAKVFNDSNRNKTLLFAGVQVAHKKANFLGQLSRKGVRTILLESLNNKFLEIHSVLRILSRENVSSVLVEGGARTYAQFIEAGLVDKYIVFIAPKIFGKGLSAFEYLRRDIVERSPNIRATSSWNLRGDIMIEARSAL
jgi:diaminohydroxyphosphoribosylaminopyrimidine deaminase/5-amino-6-(5-phosphoribosylamino)uracil reductase